MMETATVGEIQAIADGLRRRTLDMIWHAQAGHPGGSFSLAEILACLYFRILRIDPSRPDWPDRDRFILSKGHAAPIYYVALAERGFFPPETLDTYMENNPAWHAKAPNEQEYLQAKTELAVRWASPSRT